jgi:hypothetical protein
MSMSLVTMSSDNFRRSFIVAGDREVSEYGHDSLAVFLHEYISSAL